MNKNRLTLLMDMIIRLSSSSRRGRDKSHEKNGKKSAKLKEIKEGYLSLVIHEISKMVIKYNAIIAMEDLSYGFKKGRFKVERQVYQSLRQCLSTNLTIWYLKIYP